ncbi:golgin subfamily A member 6-like protein 1 isoform X3 [Solea solea]|uniref:golgin subfamily A member 6-like protein 1 isoform X3 n=1 Tax=Solea solea TaxID=90069 RepID=UPI00272B8802|nr:golgin subfamily A member 6-like protein 1 isoform X3 [Solea solea]
MNRQRKLLEVVWKPKVKLQRIELPLKDVLKEEEEEEVLTEQQLCNQERNSSLDQEEPESLQIKEEEEEICTSQVQEQLEMKQEADNFMLTPDNEESDHMEPEPDTDHQLLSAVAESQEQTGNKHVEITIVESKEEKDRQRRLMKILWKPRVKLQQIELPQRNVKKEEEEEVLTEQQQLCNQNSSLDQEEPESLQIKEEEEADTFMLTPDNEENDHMEPEPDTDHQLLSAVAESQDQRVHMRNVTVQHPAQDNPDQDSICPTERYQNRDVPVCLQEALENPALPRASSVLTLTCTPLPCKISSALGSTSALSLSVSLLSPIS